MNVALHPSASCRPQRAFHRGCSAEQAAAAPSQPAIAATSRRGALGAALLLPAAAALAAARPALADELAAALEQPAAPPALDVAAWPQWIDRTFSFSYPPGFQEVQDLSYAAPPLQRAGIDQVAENALKAEVRSADGQQRINVVVRQATAFKRTLLQVTDIAQLGDVRQVAKLLLPPGAVVAGVQQVTVEQPPRDTGTVLGVIQRDPVNYYSYDVTLPDATRLQLTAAAQLGRVYVLAATAPGGAWGQAGAALREAALSFRLRYKL